MIENQRLLTSLYAKRNIVGDIAASACHAKSAANNSCGREYFLNI
jgi:hypothetical protein